MSVRKNLISLKAAIPDNFLALQFIIKSFGLKPISWSSWKNKLGDEVNLFDDGQKIKIKFDFNDLNDLFQFSSLDSLISYSKMIILTKKKEELKAWCVGQDNIIRLISSNNNWKVEHLFSESPSLIINITNMIIGISDSIHKNHQIDDYLVIVHPFDDFIEYKNNMNFNKFWKELEV